ncbi:hypothetical protein KDM41_06795 [bacterium]|nr:hypothetical protein [bacterium]
MKRIANALLIAAVGLLLAGPAVAVIDPAPDVVGVYFDPNADTREVFVAPNVPFHVYVILTNPTHPEIWGFELGYELTPSGPAGTLFRLGRILPPDSINLGIDDDILAGSYVVGMAAPLPGAQAVVLVQWQFMLLTNMAVYFQLGPSEVQSIPDGLPAYEAGGVIVPMGLSFGCWTPGSGSVNEECGLATEESTFGAVKALYR